jgi:chromate reductase, NAD(P)H dehydrogenase (quinone)
MPPIPTVLLISGSLRAGSTNTAALRAVVGVEGIDARLFEGLGALPAFDPDLDREPLPPAVASLRKQLGEADAVLFCTPEYAGTLPGSFKNLLDWGVGGGELYEKPVGWINVSTSPAGAAGAHATLRVVLGYCGTTIVEAACAQVGVARADLDEDGTVTDVDQVAALRAVATRLVNTGTRSVGSGV